MTHQNIVGAKELWKFLDTSYVRDDASVDTFNPSISNKYVMIDGEPINK